MGDLKDFAVQSILSMVVLAYVSPTSPTSEIVGAGISIGILIEAYWLFKETESHA